MTNEQIAARLREIATNVHEHGLTGSSEKLLGIAASLEAQSAGDAGMPVVAHVWPEDKQLCCLPICYSPSGPNADGAFARAVVYLDDAQAAIAARDARIAELEAGTLRERLQRRCSDWGAYWRAPDAHGVNLTSEQAVELLRDALGVEVDLTARDEHAGVLSIMKLLEQYGGKRSELSACQIIGGMDAQFQVAQECSNLHNQIHDALCDLVKGTAADAAEVAKGCLYGEVAAAQIRAKFGVKA